MLREQNEVSNAPLLLPRRYWICFGAKGAISSLAWGSAPGIDGSQDSTAESAIHFKRD